MQRQDGRKYEKTENEKNTVPAGCGCPASYEHEWLRKRS